MANDKLDHQATAEQPGYIHQAVTLLTRRTRQALSPWVRRRLSATAPHTHIPTQGTRRQSTLTLTNTRSLLNRVQRAADRTVVGKPDIGALRPALVERFASTVADHSQALQLVGVRRQPSQSSPPTSHWKEDVELVLPVGPVSSGVGVEGLITRSGIGGPNTFSLGQRIPPMSSTPPTPRSPRPAAPPRTTRQPLRRTPSAKSRLYTRVEEIAPPSKTSPDVKVPLEQPERQADPHRAVKPPPVQREAAPEKAPRSEPPPVEREATLPEQGERQAEEPSQIVEPPPVQREAAPEMVLRTEPLPVERKAASPEQPERRLEEPRRVAERPPIQREAMPEMTPQAEPPKIEREATSPEWPERQSGKPSQVAEPSPIQREAAPEMVLRAEPPLVQREAAPEMAPQTEPPPIEREAAPLKRPGRQLEEPPRSAKPPPVQRETALPEPPERQPEEPKRAVEPLSVEREAAPEMVLRAEPPPVEREAALPERPEHRPEPSRAVEPPPLPPIQRKAAPEMVLRAAEPAPEPRRVERDIAQPVQPSQAETPTPEISKPATPLGRDILARATSRARLSLSRPRTRARPRRPMTLAQTKPEAGQVAPRSAAPETSSWALRYIRSRTASPALYAKSPDVYIGPSRSLTISGLDPANQARRRAGARPSDQMPSQMVGSPLSKIHPLALLEAWKAQDKEQLPLAFPPQPKPPRSPANALQAQPAPATQPSFGSVIQPGGPFQPPPARPLPPQPDSAQVEQPQLQLPLAETIQRQPTLAVGAFVPQDIVVQRAEGEEESDEPEELDLTELSRRVYPLVKRLLAIERERMPGRLV